MRDRPPPERGAFLETLALALTQKVQKCNHFGGSSIPFPPWINVGSWISCVCQHLKIVWESSKSDPASLSNLTRHAFALALTQKMKKCEHCQSENAPKVSQKFACQPFFLQMARAEIRTDHAGQKYTFT